MSDNKTVSTRGRRVRVIKLKSGPRAERAYQKVDGEFGRIVSELQEEFEERQRKAALKHQDFKITY